MFLPARVYALRTVPRTYQPVQHGQPQWMMTTVSILVHAGQNKRGQKPGPIALDNLPDSSMHHYDSGGGTLDFDARARCSTSQFYVCGKPQGEDGHIKAESDNNPNKRLQQQQSDTISALEAAPNGGDSSCSSAAVDLTRSTGLIVSTVPIEATGNAAQVEPVHGRNGLPDVSAAATADVAGARAEAGPGGTGAGVEVKKCEVSRRIAAQGTLQRRARASCEIP